MGRTKSNTARSLSKPAPNLPEENPDKSLVDTSDEDKDDGSKNSAERSKSGGDNEDGSDEEVPMAGAGARRTTASAAKKTAPTFALLPSHINLDDWIDFQDKNALQIFYKTTEPLDKEDHFGMDPEGLYGFLKGVEQRANKAG